MLSNRFGLEKAKRRSIFGGLCGRGIGPNQVGTPPAYVAAFAVALAAYAVTVCTPPAFDARWSLYLDSSSLYWAQKLWDDSLFPRDAQAAFFLSKLKVAHPGLLWIWLTALFMRPFPYPVGLKFLSVLVCVASALQVRQLALASAARKAAGAATVLFTVLFLSMDTFWGAPRMFGAVVFFGFAVALEQKRFLALPPIVVICSAVYPTASLGLGFTAALAPCFFRDEFSAQKLLPRYLFRLVVAAAFCVLLGARNLAGLHSFPDPARVAAFQSDKFCRMAGAAPLNPENPVDALAHFILNFNEHGRLYITLLALFLLTYGLGLLVLPQRPAFLPRSIPVLLTGCATAFLSLYAIHPVSASRQLVFVVPLAIVFLCTDGLRAIFGERLRTRTVAIICGIGFACMHPWLGETVSMRDYSPVYDFLSAQPAGILAAGYPESPLVNTVPVFARRGVLLSSETKDHDVLFLRGPAEYSSRHRAVLEALYCVPGAREHLVRDYHVDWLLVEKKLYTPEVLSMITSSVPADSSAAAIARHGTDACYLAYVGEAGFYWKSGDVEGVAVRLAPEVESKNDI